MDVDPFGTPSAPSVPLPPPATDPVELAREAIRKDSTRTRRGKDSLIIPSGGLLVSSDGSVAGGTGTRT